AASRLDEAAIEPLRSAIRGELIGPEDPAYESARRVYNGAVHRRPRLIVRVADVANIVTALRFGREHDLTIAVRGGGHHGAGFGTVDGGLVIDLGRLKG